MARPPSYDEFLRAAEGRSLEWVDGLCPRCQPVGVMSHAAQAILEAFEHLAEPEREEVFRTLLRRAAEWDYQAFTDEELLAAGRGLFQSLDAQEEAK